MLSHSQRARTRRVAILIAVLPALITGCVSTRTIAQHPSRSATEERWVAGEGFFALRQVEKGQPAKPLSTPRVDPGVIIGFQRDQDGSLNAISGDQRYPLDEGSYEWRFTPENPPENPIGGVATSVAVIALSPVLLVMALLFYRSGC